jgi:hypothetical protein
MVFGFAFRRRGKPTKPEPSEYEPDHGTDYETGYEVHHRTSRVGQMESTPLASEPMLFPSTRFCAKFGAS